MSQPTTAADAATPPATGPTSRRPGGQTAAIVVGLTVAVALMLLAFLTPAIHSGARDLPLAVSGPAPVVAKVTAALDQQRPGAFAVTTYDAPDRVVDALRHREAIGGISLGTDGVTIRTAGAAGAPYAASLQALGAGLAASGQKVSYQDVVPLTTKDPAGSGLAALALPLIFGGMASAVLLATRVRGSGTLRVAASLTFAVLAGLTATAILQYGFGSIDGNYLATAGAVSLGIAAISLTILGLESALGFAGLGLGALLLLFIANPLSGFATGWWWLPQPWGLIGQYLPVGAAGTLIRSTAFFGGAGAGRALVVLVCWALAGLVLSLVPTRRTARTGA